ncbi:hypothetical protein GFS24_16980 [Chitinophaga sp. SYP-B3965]|uniref:DUF5522 domain-containing protein n=1 Tax=Chitinophaga sp. SYP-B3965 TaxID=2663120 RepID=UPI001299F791|nr:DUF5522 domain-containing protein [Chitinophaga sp. SYP-B3965]MRG46817.1 hypothetical protein [Chitinophaga sp. SYP-B3965]
MKQLEENIDFYYNEQGYMVLTEKYHRERGYCCGNGCLHCPFDYEKVPDDKKERLLAARRQKNGEA